MVICYFLRRTPLHDRLIRASGRDQATRGLAVRATLASTGAAFTDA